MKSFILEIILLVLAILIFPLLFLIGFLYTFVKHTILLDWSLSKQLTPIIRSISLLLDGLANAGAGELINDVLKVEKESNIRFGKWYQTISAIAGLLLIISSKDSKLRSFLDIILGKDHCKKAITPQDIFYYNHNM